MIKLDQYEINEILRVYKFELAGEILIEERHYGPSPIFTLFDEYKTGNFSKFEGWVYLWIHIVDNNSSNICYVGKAGGTIRSRCTQHVGGARTGSSGSKKGRENAQRIQDCLADGGRVELYVRKSEYVDLLGEANICLCETEEKAMIEKFKRLGAQLWNKEK